MPWLALILATSIVLTNFTLLSSAQAEQWNVHFWMKAFIPNEHPRVLDYITRTTSGVWVIPAPKIPQLINIGSLSGSCFATDNRLFSIDPNASARVTTEFMILINGRDLKIENYPGRNKIRIGETHNVDCKTGKELRPPETESAETVSIGEVKSSGFNRLFFIKVTSSNPFYKIFGISLSPSIDYSLNFTYNSLHKKIEIKGATGFFPSFEAYYSINNGSVVTILKSEPHGDSTATSLFDLNLGINTVNFEGVIQLP